MHILYSFRRCPYAMRARMALAISSVEFEHREVLLRDKPAEMLDISPKATVPVLALTDGKILDESLDIMLWALAQNDPDNWLTPGLENMLPHIETITGDFKDHLDRYKYASRYAENESRGSVDHDHRKQACDILQNYENTLSSQSYLMGERASLADFAIFPFIRQFSNVEREWWDRPHFPALHEWLEKHLASNIFTYIMRKHPVWKPDRK